MALTKEFTEAVDGGKKTRVRIMLKDIMLVDPSLKIFNEMLAYAENNMSDLYDLHDGEKLYYNSATWDEDYMNQQMVSVVTNFSKERIELLGKIVKKRYAYKFQPEITVNSNRSNNANLTGETSNGGLTGVQIAGGIIAVAGAGVLIGGVVGSSVPIAIVGGVALVGGTALIAFGGNKEV